MCRSYKEIWRTRARELKAQIIKENPMAGLEYDELMSLKAMCNDAKGLVDGNTISPSDRRAYNKIEQELSHRREKKE